MLALFNSLGKDSHSSHTKNPITSCMQLLRQIKSNHGKMITLSLVSHLLMVSIC